MRRLLINLLQTVWNFQLNYALVTVQILSGMFSVNNILKIKICLIPINFTTNNANPFVSTWNKVRNYTRMHESVYSMLRLN